MLLEKKKNFLVWLVRDYLGRAELRLYGLEYSTALLMNLCLHRAGKEQCVPIARPLLQTLATLVARNIAQVRFKLVNQQSGSKESLFSRKQEKNIGRC